VPELVGEREHAPPLARVVHQHVRVHARNGRRWHRIRPDRQVRDRSRRPPVPLERAPRHARHLRLRPRRPGIGDQDRERDLL